MFGTGILEVTGSSLKKKKPTVPELGKNYGTRYYIAAFSAAQRCPIY
jgi:hypothetical protein